MLDENVNDKKIEELNKKLDDLYEKFRKQSSKNLIKIFSLIIGLFGSAVIINSFIVTPSFAILSFFTETVLFSATGLAYTKKISKKIDEIAKEIRNTNDEITKLDQEKKEDIIRREYIKKSQDMFELERHPEELMKKDSYVTKEVKESNMYVDDSLNINYDDKVKKLNNKQKKNG